MKHLKKFESHSKNREEEIRSIVNDRLLLFADIGIPFNFNQRGILRWATRASDGKSTKDELIYNLIIGKSRDSINEEMIDSVLSLNRDLKSIGLNIILMEFNASTKLDKQMKIYGVPIDKTYNTSEYFNKFDKINMIYLRYSDPIS